MEQSELLEYIARILEKMSLRYFVTGSVARRKCFGGPCHDADRI